MALSLAEMAARQPRVRVVPRVKAVDNDGPDAVELGAAYGLTADGWQAECLTDWGGRDKNGRYTAATCALAVPRQNGKNAVLEIRELFGMVILGEKFLHTAHQVKTARKAFLRIASFFENERDYPELAAMVKEIRKTNGQEAVVLTNGGSVEFIARSNNSGRGFTVDVLVCDEAQDLKDDELAALLPTISAAPLGNPQVILTGTPPDPEKGETGEAFIAFRRAAFAREDRAAAFTDWGVADGPLPDVRNRDLWFLHNPAMPDRLNPAEAEREFRLLSPEAFARERLGWWGNPDDTLGRVIGSIAWDGCRDATSKVTPSMQKHFALDVAPDGSSAAIGVAALRRNGRCHVEVTSREGIVDHRPGTDWVVDRARALVGRYGDSTFSIIGGSSAEALVPDLMAAGVRVNIVPASDVPAACGAFLIRANTSMLAHVGQDVLDAAIAAARSRTVGDGAWAFTKRRSAADIAPLYAVTIALWVAVMGTSTNYAVADSIY